MECSGSVLGEITDASGLPFDQQRLGAMTFYGNELVIADHSGLQFYALSAQ